MTFFFQPFRISERLFYGENESGHDTGGYGSDPADGYDSGWGGSGGGDDTATPGAEGATGDEPYTAPKPKYDRYDAWKAAGRPKDPGDFSAEEIASYNDTDYAEWRAGAHPVFFEDWQVQDFEARDMQQGESDERKTARMDWASKEAHSVKYDPETGRPIAIVKQVYKMVDGVPQWVEEVVKDLSRYGEMLDEIEGTKFVRMEDAVYQNTDPKGQYYTTDPAKVGQKVYNLNDIGESYQFKQIGTLADQLSAGSFDEDAIKDAMKYAAQGLGFGSTEEHQAYLESIRGTNPNDMEGMGAEEMATRQGLNRETFRQQELVATRALENIRASGKSTAQYLMRADEYISKLTSQKLQADMMLAQEHYQRQDAQLQAQMKRYEFMVQTGNMSRTEYLQMYQENRAMGIQAYAVQINAMFQENQEVFQQYQGDQQALAANLQNMYAAMNAEMGFDQWAIDTASTLYNNNLAPLLIEMNNLAQEEYQDYLDEMASIQKQANMMNFVGGIIGGLGKIFNPFG